MKFTFKQKPKNLFTLPEKIEPLEDLWHISHSQANTWLECEMKWYYKYYLGLVPLDTQPRYFAMGSLMHSLLDIYYQVYDADETPEQRWEFMQERIMELWPEDVSSLTEEQVGQMQELERAMKAMYRYVNHWSPQIDEDIEVIGSEVHFNVLLRTPHDREFILNGYVDLHYKKKGQFVVRDHKTHAGDKWWGEADMQYDGQQPTYAAGLLERGNRVDFTEISEINTYAYKNWDSISNERLFHTRKMAQSPSKLHQTKLWFGGIVDRFHETTNYQRNISRHTCKYCPFRVPCHLEKEGKDASVVIRNAFGKRGDSASQVDTSDVGV